MAAEKQQLSFSNTQFAFEYKTDEELKKAKFLFASMGKKWLVQMGTKITPLAVKWNIPFVRSIVRSTIFRQFVGGETLEQTAIVADKLEAYNVQVILDYGVEGKEGEENFEAATQEFIKVINYAGSQKNIPFISIKVTGFARFSLLEKLDEVMNKASGTLMQRFNHALSTLSAAENAEWQRVVARMQQICHVAATQKIGVLVDAEETWIQDPVDALTILMMDALNKTNVVVYNTVQLYRHDRLQFLHNMHEAAVTRNFILGAKLVRGAYMEKERKRAAEMNYPSPIQASKQNTDDDYNAALLFCLNNLKNIAVIVATHNEDSSMLTTKILLQNNEPLNHPHVHFSQLYGMSDNITFNLAKAGCSVSKYLPFGPITDVVPYLMRRAQENSSVSGQTGRELQFINKEMERRRL
jgi:proline dehydrogenase